MLPHEILFKVNYLANSAPEGAAHYEHGLPVQTIASRQHSPYHPIHPV